MRALTSIFRRFTESGKTFKQRLCFCGYISDFLSIEDADEPPVAVAVIHQKEAVTTEDTRLSVHSCDETVEGVDMDSLGMEREEEPPASSSVCSSRPLPPESSRKTECPPLLLRVAVTAFMRTSCVPVSTSCARPGHFVCFARGLVWSVACDLEFYPH